jgi:hypothetical protein
MPLRALRKAMVAFATFDSVAACRACVTQNAPSEPQSVPAEPGANQQTGESASSEHASPADVSREAKT